MMILSYRYAMFFIFEQGYGGNTCFPAVLQSLGTSRDTMDGSLIKETPVFSRCLLWWSGKDTLLRYRCCRRPDLIRAGATNFCFRNLCLLTLLARILSQVLLSKDLDTPLCAIGCPCIMLFTSTCHRPSVRTFQCPRAGSTHYRVPVFSL